MVLHSNTLAGRLQVFFLQSKTNNYVISNQKSFLQPSMASTHCFSLLMLLSFLVSSNSQEYVLPDRHFINCGSTSDDSDIEFTGRKFISDFKPTSFSVSGDISTTAKNDNNTELIYQTARVFNKRSWYEMEADGTNTFVMVRLHFSLMSSSDKLKVSKFEVSSLGFSLLSNFSVNSTVIREFIIPIGSEPTFRIEFEPSDGSSSAFVNAIEAFTTPPDLFIHDVNVPYLSLAGNDRGGFENLASDYAFNPVHRINVGGQKIGVEDDTLRRIWVPDDSFILNNSKPPAKNQSFDGQEDFYKDGGATKFDAPAGVYGTAKELDTDSNDISWKFGVNKKAMYLVRAHFCNILSYGIRDPNDEFDFVIYSHRKEIKWAEKRLATAFFDDFVVDSDDSGIVDISIGRILNKGQLAFLNGLEIMELLKGSGPDDLGSDGKSKDYKSVFIILGCVVFVVVLLLGFWIGLKYAKVKRRSQAEILYGGDSDTSITVDPNLKLSLKVPFADILSATNNFDENLMIGSGGFGKVYKGILTNGREVAVKRGGKGHGQGQPEFVTEILVFSRIQHRHLVSLIGYCDENSEMILVYEFMEKGTLQDHLYNAKENHPKLSWKKRLEICIDAAEGLHYLHTGSDDGIIHRDVKSTNILLDKDYVAKVADFGISRSGNLDPTETSFIKGSFGYMDPEYLSYLKLTKKSDVYSFGVVLLEVLCARPAILPGDNLAHWAIKEIENGNVDAIIDPFLADTINANSLRKFLDTVKGSLKVKGDERPSMEDVKWNLKYALNFQQMVVDREPHEDSTIIDSSLQLRMSMIHHLPSYDIDYSLGNDNSAELCKWKQSYG